MNSPKKYTNQQVRKQTQVLYDCMTRGSTSTLEANLIGTPNDPNPKIANSAAAQPHHCVQPAKIETGIPKCNNSQSVFMIFAASIIGVKVKCSTGIPRVLPVVLVQKWDYR